MKPTLLLLAAGMGSRYGGLKQLDGLGPNGETIMDYSIYDAIKAGFGKSFLSFVRISKHNSVKKCYLNTKGIYLQNSYSKALMHCPKALRCPKEEKNHGEPTTLYLWQNPLCTNLSALLIATTFTIVMHLW